MKKQWKIALFLGMGLMGSYGFAEEEKEQEELAMGKCPESSPTPAECQVPHLNRGEGYSECERMLPYNTECDGQYRTSAAKQAMLEEEEQD